MGGSQWAMFAWRVCCPEFDSPTPKRCREEGRGGGRMEKEGEEGPVHIWGNINKPSGS